MGIALVTGSSRGLGRSTVLHLADKGHDVIVTFRSKKAEADQVVAEIQSKGRRAVAIQLDVGDSSSFEKFKSEVSAALRTTWSRKDFDFLVNNAGVGVNTAFMETSESQFDDMVNIHLKGPFFLSQKLIPLMKDGGRIINLSSGLARFSKPGYAAYGTMKGAIDVLTRYMAAELGKRQITVNSIAPGPIETDFGGGVVRDNPQVNKLLAAESALGRVGVPDDVGGLIAAFLSEDTRWVNAQRIEAAGGINI